MPAVTELRTPPATQGQVISLWSQGTPKRQIARTLGIDKNTVASILKAYAQDKPKSDRVSQLVPLAYDALEKGLISGKPELALRFLEATELAPHRAPTVNVAGDLSLSTASLLMPTITPVSTERTGTELAAPTEAAAKPHGLEMGLSLQTNFSQFSDEQLEAELARRRASRAPVLDAEVIP